MDQDVAFQENVPYLVDGTRERKSAFIVKVTDELMEQLEAAARMGATPKMMIKLPASKTEHGKVVIGDREFSLLDPGMSSSQGSSGIIDVCRVDSAQKRVDVVATVRNKFIVQQMLNARVANKLRERTIEADEEKNIVRQVDAIASTAEIVMKAGGTNKRKNMRAPVRTTLLGRPGPDPLVGRVSPLPANSNLRIRALHLLALRNWTLTDLENKLQCKVGEAKCQLLTILNLIASQTMGEYELKATSFKEVQVHTWSQYSALEREQILDKMRTVFDRLGMSEAEKQNYLEKKESSGPSSATVSRMPEVVNETSAPQLLKPKMRQLNSRKAAVKKASVKAAADKKKGAKPTKAELAKNQVEEENTKATSSVSVAVKSRLSASITDRDGMHTASSNRYPPFTGGRSHSPDGLSDHFPPISNTTQYQQYYTEFRNNYPRYLELAERLRKNNAETQEIGEKVKQATYNSKEYLDLKLKLQTRFRSMHRDLESWLDEYSHLHEKLSLIKNHIHTYDKQTA